VLFVKGFKGGRVERGKGYKGHRAGAVPGLTSAIIPAPGGCRLLVEVQPGSSRPGKLLFDPWRKRIRLAVGERAEKGRANGELLAALASALGVPEGSLSITAGLTDRRKTVEVAGLEAAEALDRLAPLVKGG
jgi:uncharacterized protein (TIGR00251 family)